MQITVITSPGLKVELLQQVLSEEEQTDVQYVTTVTDVHPSTNVVIDLLFTGHDQAIAQLEALQAGLVIVHAPVITLQQLPENFARINAWPSFLQRPVVEAVAIEAIQTQVQQVFQRFNKKVLFTADAIGFVSARVVAAIINEAYLSLAEGLSTKEAMDTAMKMGTNYPYGPFEWANKIGKKELSGLLQALAQQQSRYTAAPLLVKETAE
jgi:3-hydroxybutyryl-CoA dehydrogenase